MLSESEVALFGVKRYYESELRKLREDAVVFSRDYPAVAQELQLSQGESTDPQVELLMQSFAFLVARLRYDLDADEASIPNSVLQQLYPQLTSPLPSMAVTQIDVRADGANFAAGWTLVRGRQFVATAVGEGGRSIQCRFRTCYDTPLWPLQVVGAEFVPVNRYDFLRSHREVASVLRVHIRAHGNTPICQLPLRQLRFHLSGEEQGPFRLYERLALDLAGVAVTATEDSATQILAPSALRWLGFLSDEAVLPDRTDSAPAYRLLQEYSTFPEKFLFFELQDPDCTGASQELFLLFLLKSSDTSLPITSQWLRLNCVPLINLYTQPFEPLRLDHRDHEYRLMGDQSAHAYCELHSLEEVRAVKPGGSSRPISPYFALEEYGKLERRDYFYGLRRELSRSKSVPGTELYISFLDRELDLALTARETIAGRAVCTNRRLPERMREGDYLLLEGPGPVQAAKLVGKPTPHHTPRLIGQHPWSLVAQLGLNYLSLTQAGLDALKSILRSYTIHGGQQAIKQIDSLLRMQSEPIVRRIGDGAGRGFCRGIAVRIVVDQERFEGGSVLLFGEVLRHFFALYANINSFTQLTLESQQRKEEIRRWPPLAGVQIVL